MKIRVQSVIPAKADEVAMPNDFAADVATRASLEKNAEENAFFKEVWESQKAFAEIAVPLWAGAQASNAQLGKAFADSLKT